MLTFMLQEFEHLSVQFRELETDVGLGGWGVNSKVELEISHLGRSRVGRR